ncbi:MAG TPA: hypothetical protein VNX68_08840 [Nitrosopumilaceae archaeon]|jgi:hypothetical protein|nr:hypothetical protein [Nitrosopumilaceae archaeon]
MAGIGDMLSSFFSPEEGYEEAEQILRQFWNEAKKTQQPFINQGQEQYGNLMGAENALLDPQSLLAKWMGGYEASPYAKRSMENARAGGLDAASSMGLLGSNAAINNIQQSSSDIMNKDRSEYLQDLMYKYLSGIGIGENIYGTGANMAANLGNLSQGFGQNIAGARYGAKNAPGNLLGNLLSMAANAAAKGGAFGAGGAFGGGAGSIAA